jgi:hypothetical protein
MKKRLRSAMTTSFASLPCWQLAVC